MRRAYWPALTLPLLVLLQLLPADTAFAEEASAASATASLAQLQANAQEGDADSALALAEYYRLSNDAAAYRWFQRAAERGSVQAEAILGDLYATGQLSSDYDAEDGRWAKPRLARKWYLRAARHGNPYAMYGLAKWYGYRHDDAQSTRWELRRRKALQNVPPLYFSSLSALDPIASVGYPGLRADAAQRVQRIRRDAARGNAAAQVDLGVMHNFGVGVDSDDAQAAQWYRRAAEQGDAFGQYFLGLMYGQGHGVAKDEQQAAHWFAKAHAQGYYLAAERYWRERIEPPFFLFGE